MSFSPWFPLSTQGIEQHAPNAPAAVQVKRERGLIVYPTGKSAMVFYFFAESSAADAIRRLFEDEIDEPGTRGHGTLRYRVWDGSEARGALETLFSEFVDRFGSAPALHNGPQPVDREPVDPDESQTRSEDADDDDVSVDAGE